jgi:type IV secretory pathway VirB4 component
MAGEKNKLVRNRVNVSTQQFLDIAEIKDDTVVLRDGTLRAVLSVSSINFSLKSEDEQNAVIAAYVGFLNNINSSIQIVIQSRELNIDGYIQFLMEKEKAQTNKLLKMQTAEYINYIKELISIGKIMTKSFYLTVPYSPTSDSHKSFLASFLETLKPATLLKLKDVKFQKYRRTLERRVDSLIGGLESMGIEVVQLTSQQLIELFYKTYNPEVAKNEQMTDVNKLRVEV